MIIHASGRHCVQTADAYLSGRWSNGDDVGQRGLPAPRSRNNDAQEYTRRAARLSVPARRRTCCTPHHRVISGRIRARPRLPEDRASRFFACTLVTSRENCLKKKNPNDIFRPVFTRGPCTALGNNYCRNLVKNNSTACRRIVLHAFWNCCKRKNTGINLKYITALWICFRWKSVVARVLNVVLYIESFARVKDCLVVVYRYRVSHSSYQ